MNHTSVSSSKKTALGQFDNMSQKKKRQKQHRKEVRAERALTKAPLRGTVYSPKGNLYGFPVFAEKREPEEYDALKAHEDEDAPESVQSTYAAAPEVISPLSVKDIRKTFDMIETQDKKLAKIEVGNMRIFTDYLTKHGFKFESSNTRVTAFYGIPVIVLNEVPPNVVFLKDSEGEVIRAFYI